MKQYLKFHSMLKFSNPIIFSLIFIFNILTVDPSSEALAAICGKISGKICDTKTGDPLPGANIMIIGTSLGTSSDLEGDYFIANLPTGLYSVKATMMGYGAVTFTNVQVRPNRTTEVNFNLEETVIEGEEIVVMAERPLIEKDNTSSIVILGRREIVAQPTTELNQVLTTLPSINVENGELKFRGGTMDQVAFLIDGTRARGLPRTGPILPARRGRHESEPLLAVALDGPALRRIDLTVLVGIESLGDLLGAGQIVARRPGVFPRAPMPSRRLSREALRLLLREDKQGRNRHQPEQKGDPDPLPAAFEVERGPVAVEHHPAEETADEEEQGHAPHVDELGQPDASGRTQAGPSMHGGMRLESVNEDAQQHGHRAQTVHGVVPRPDLNDPGIRT